MDPSTSVRRPLQDVTNGGMPLPLGLPCAMAQPCLSPSPLAMPQVARPGLAPIARGYIAPQGSSSGKTGSSPVKPVKPRYSSQLVIVKHKLTVSTPLATLRKRA